MKGLTPLALGRQSQQMQKVQLNIKIDVDLLQKIKSHSIREGLTTTEFVSKTLEQAIAEHKALNVEERLSRLEEKLGLRG
ncbi:MULTISPECIES: hypothetical protein [unclassified Synechococcus]|uniref:hypothetical protein n=1 Tax=unclassified Synechococcus TaxID=2626047 RepID=UPI0020013C2A|nr:hypothetical protein [Synechococcus sp. A10-1-5-1]UPM50221.1 hypothetical protein MY494_13100 [Synechococcus sp. A10-1-5-1]